MASPIIDCCTEAEWPVLLAALDATFVTERGRTGSLASRFPNAMGQTAFSNTLVLRTGEEISSCCVMREFDWITPDAQWRGAMIGMVYTRAATRGRGYAAQVLSHAITQLHAKGVDFAVLWSGLDHYYENLGWMRHDRGIIGVLNVTLPPALSRHPLPTFAQLNHLQREHQTQRVQRDAADWTVTPLPAHTTETAWAMADEDAYALFGLNGETRYVYEVVGKPESFPMLWHQISAGARQVYVNDVVGSAWHRWLIANTAMQFKDQALAHWRLLSPRAHQARWRGWHIPWFDRI